MASRLALAASVLALSGFQVVESAFATTWEVGIPQAAVREYVGGPIMFTLRSGTAVALTGRCTRGLNLDAIANLRPWRQQWKISKHWCETEPLLGSRGWIFGGYLVPVE